MSDDRDGFRFDLATRRFIEQRWETEIGKRVLADVIQGILDRVEIRAILDPYVLKHPENSDSWSHPIYPRDAITSDRFWVLNNDDLRGVSFYHQDFGDTPSLEKKALTYATLFGCGLQGANFYGVDLSYARVERCDLRSAIFMRSGGFGTRMTECNVRDADLSESGWIDTDWKGTDLSGCYWNDVRLEQIHVDYRTLVDTALVTQRGKRSLPRE